MSIERLTRAADLPQPGIEEEGYIRQLVNDLEAEKLTDIHSRINLLIDLQDSTIAYLGLKDSTGDYSNGTWRINGDSSAELLVQIRIAGSWVTVMTVNPIAGVDLSGVVVYDDTVVCYNGEVIQV